MFGLEVLMRILARHAGDWSRLVGKAKKENYDEGSELVNQRVIVPDYQVV